MSRFDRQLQILRVVVLAIDDQQILAPAGDEKLTVGTEVQVSGAQELSAVVADSGLEGLCRGLLIAEVACRDTVRRRPRSLPRLRRRIPCPVRCSRSPRPIPRSPGAWSAPHRPSRPSPFAAAGTSTRCIPRRAGLIAASRPRLPVTPSEPRYHMESIQTDGK
jgi:hypothetical protein